MAQNPKETDPEILEEFAQGQIEQSEEMQQSVSGGEQNVHTEIQEGLTEEVEKPLSDLEIQNISTVQGLVGGDEPTFIEETEEEAKALVGAGMKAVEDASPEARKRFYEMQGDTPSVSPLTQEEQEKSNERALERQLMGEGQSVAQIIELYDWEKTIKHNKANSPNGFVEKILANNDYSERIFDDMGNGREQGVHGVIREIVMNNLEIAFSKGHNFDADKAQVNLLGKLYIDLAFKLGKDISGLDLNNEEFRSFLKTNEALNEVANGLAHLRDAKRGMHKFRAGDKTSSDSLDRIKSRGVFDGSGSTSQFRSGMTKEEWDEDKPWYHTTWDSITTTGSYVASRLGRMGGLPFNERRFTPVGGEIIGTMATYIVPMIAAARKANAMGLGKLGVAMATEVAGAVADYALTVKGEGNLANMLDEYDMLPEHLEWLKIQEDEDLSQARMKNMIEGGLIAAPIALFMYAAKYGGKAAIKFGESFTPDALTDSMRKRLQKTGDDIWTGESERIVKMYSGIPLDPRDMWETILSLRAIGKENLGKAQEALEELETNFSKATKDMSPAEVKKIKDQAKQIDDARVQAREEVDIEEKEYEQIFGKTWQDLKGDARMNVLQFASLEYRTARRWNDTMKVITRLKNLDRELTKYEADMLRRAEEVVPVREAEVDTVMEGKINMKDWDQQNETLAEFLQRNNIETKLPDDEIERIREIKRKQSEAKGETDELFSKIEDEKLRESVKSKVISGEELTKEEQDALNEATGLFTKSQIDAQNKIIEDLEAGKITDIDRKLLKNSRRFKSWIDELEDEELKESLLEAIASGRVLTKAEAKALKDAGVSQIYKDLRKKGLLGVDGDDVLNVNDQIENINSEISNVLKNISKKSAKDVEAAEKKLARKAKELQDLNDKFDNLKKPLTNQQRKKLAQAEEGKKIAKEELESLRKQSKKTPQALYKLALQKARSAKKVLDKFKDKLEKDKLPLTKEELEQQAKAIADEKSAKKEIDLIKSKLSETERGKLIKLERQARNAKNKLDKLTKRLREEQSEESIRAAEADRIKVQEEIDRLESEEIVIKDELKSTKAQELHNLQVKQRRKKKVVDRLQEKVDKGNKLTKEQQAEKAEAEEFLGSVDERIAKLKKDFDKTDARALERLKARQRSKDARVKDLKKKLKESETPLKEGEIDAARQRLRELQEQEAKLALEAGQSPRFALNRVDEMLRRAEKLSESVEEATGEINPLRLAYAELGRSFKEANAKEASDEAIDRLERAFYEVIKERINVKKANKIPLTQSEKIADSYSVVGLKADKEDLRTWALGNKNNGHFTGQDIKNFLNKYRDQYSKKWGGKEAHEAIDGWIDRHAYLKHNSVMKRSGVGADGKFNLLHALPVWFQMARQMRVVSAVTGTGTSVLAGVFGLVATGSRKLFRTTAKGLLWWNRDVRNYSKYVNDLKKFKAGELTDPPSFKITKDSAPTSKVRRNLWNVLFSPTRRTKDVESGSRNDRLASANFEGYNLEHLGAKMDATSMTMLGLRAQAIENDLVRGIVTSMVGLAEFMPREIMGGIDDMIKGATFSSTLREEVIDAMYRTNPELLVKDGVTNTETMGRIVTAVEMLEVKLRSGEIQQSQIRTKLGELLGGDAFSDEVKLAVQAREAAWETQRQLTMQQEVYGVAKALHDLSRNAIGGHFFMFGRTTGNTINMGLERVPILGYLYKRAFDKRYIPTNPKDKIDMMAKQLSGMSLIGGGYAITEWARENVRKDKYGNYVFEIKPPEFLKEGARNWMLDQAENAIDQQPEYAEAMIDAHNDYVRAFPNQGSREYDKNNPDDKRAYIEEEFMPVNAEGKTTFTLKRLGFSWGLLTLGMATHEAIHGTANSLPKQTLDEIGMPERLSNIVNTFTNTYGLADVSTGLDDMFAMFDPDADFMTQLAFMLSEAITPMKGLMSSPGEPMNLLRRRTIDGDADRRVDWKAASYWEKVIDRSWLFGNLENIPTIRDAMFHPIRRGTRFAMLADTEFELSPFQVEMNELDIDMKPVQPKKLSGNKKSYSGFDTYSFKHTDPDNDQTMYEWIVERANTTQIGVRNLNIELKEFFNSNEYKQKKKVIKAGLKLVRGEATDSNGNKISYDKDNDKHLEMKQAAVDAQMWVREELKNKRKKYTDKAIREFENEAMELFKDENGLTANQLKEKQQSVVKGAERFMSKSRRTKNPLDLIE
jgi:hypothetical protein|tara:strand:+ start:448 stop:7035 length:6588 start_codon:yes stop_codon:yes gene_type:complete